MVDLAHCSGIAVVKVRRIAWLRSWFGHLPPTINHHMTTKHLETTIIMNSTDIDARSTTSSTTRSSRDSWWDLMIDDKEEEDKEELTRGQQTTQAIVTSTVMAATWSFLQLLHQHNIERRPLFTCRRVNWEEHVRDLLKEGNEFRKDYAPTW
jgi:hypothetical protein